MSINRSTFRERLSKGPGQYTEIRFAEAARQGSVCWRVYAVDEFSQHLFIDYARNKAEAGRIAGCCRRWLEEYNNDHF